MLRIIKNSAKERSTRSPFCAQTNQDPFGADGSAIAVSV